MSWVLKLESIVDPFSTFYRFFFQFKTVAIIAEGIPERITQLLNKKAKEKGVVIIGPATVSNFDNKNFDVNKWRQKILSAKNLVT